jgi:hypothetical protein
LPVQHFELNAPAPVRALAISAAVAVVAMVALILWGVTDAVVVLVLGIIALVLALALAGGALFLTRKLRTSIVLDEDAITVSQAGSTHALAWSDVEEVGLRGRHLVLSAKPGQGEDASVLNPRTRYDPAFLAVVTAVRDRLDADRGYGARPFE